MRTCALGSRRRIFVALNVPGRYNNLRHPEHGPRMQAAFAWLEEAAALASSRKGLVIMMQANLFTTAPRDGFRTLRERLEHWVRAVPGHRIHGDTHLYRDDEPVPGVRRVEVWGSPFIDWTTLGL